jgi:hypothetical protein
MKRVILIAAILWANMMNAQREETIIGDAGWGFSGAWGGWSYNLGNFNKDYSGYNGGIWALEFGKKFYIGGLHYDLKNAPLANNSSYNLISNNLLLGFTPIAYKPIHPIISMALGSSKLQTSSEISDDRVFAFHPSVGLELNVTRWCHIDAQIGYRFITDNDFTKYKDSDFSGAYGQVNLKFGWSWGRYKTKKIKD